MLQSGAMEGAYWRSTLSAVPQGGVISPLRSNIYLHPFDEAIMMRRYRLTRWADDFVIPCRTQKEAQIALKTARKFLQEKLNVEINEQKTRIVRVRWGFTNSRGSYTLGQSHSLTSASMLYTTRFTEWTF